VPQGPKASESPDSRAHRTARQMATDRHSSNERVVIIGSGLRFASGISHYSCLLSCALKDEYNVGALLMRRLVPRRLYPGRDRVGTAVANAVAYPSDVPVYDGVDWYWGPSLTNALRFLDHQRPTVVIFQWWTGAVLHTYLRLARYAARHGARLILEWHERQDVGEAAISGARRYVEALMPHLLPLMDAHVVHSRFDIQAISSGTLSFRRSRRPMPRLAFRSGCYISASSAPSRAWKIWWPRSVCSTVIRPANSACR
jgi:hypothetical protein